MYTSTKTEKMYSNDYQLYIQNTSELLSLVELSAVDQLWQSTASRSTPTLAVIKIVHLLSSMYVCHSRFGQKSSLFKYQKNYTSKSKASFQYLWVRTAQEKILRVCFPRENFLFDIEGSPLWIWKIFGNPKGYPSMSNKKFSLRKHTLKIFS